MAAWPFRFADGIKTAPQLHIKQRRCFYLGQTSLMLATMEAFLCFMLKIWENEKFYQKYS